jgi:hypothetical protein
VLTSEEKRDVFDRLGVRGLERLQDGDPSVKKGWLPPHEVLRRHYLKTDRDNCLKAGRTDCEVGWVDWVITGIFAWLEGSKTY